MGVTAQWFKFSLDKFRERFEIHENREIKDLRNISEYGIRYNQTPSHVINDASARAPTATTSVTAVDDHQPPSALLRNSSSVHHLIIHEP